MAVHWEIPVKRGCRHPLAHFKTESELERLRAFVASHPTMTLRGIAAEFGCSHLCIWRILKKITYTAR